jgi:hypothetical protein
LAVGPPTGSVLGKLQPAIISPKIAMSANKIKRFIYSSIQKLNPSKGRNVPSLLWYLENSV